MERFLLRPRLVKEHVIPAFVWTSVLVFLFIANVVHGDIEANRIGYSILGDPARMFSHIVNNEHDIAMLITFFIIWAAGSLIGIYSVNKIDDELVSRKKVIDDLRALQERYDNVASTVMEWIWEVDAEGKFVYASEQVRDILGYSPDEMIGKYYYDFFTEEARSGILETAKKVFEEKAVFHRFVNENNTKDGREVILETNAIPLLDKETNTLLGYVGSGKDITNQLKARQVLEDSLKEKELLLREIHHRVKNNMAVISSLLQLQSRYVDDKKYLNMFKDCQSRIQSMILVHEMLYQSECFTDINVQEYVMSLVQNVRTNFAGDKEISITTDVKDIRMNIDNLVPLGIIMNEILTNAIRHAFNEQTFPGITLIMQKDEDNNVTLTITDNGVGLPEEFDMSNSGGLGMRLIQILTDQIEGRLDVIHKDGTIFKLTFPG